ncbi:MAG: membrane protein insertion efficiency factor YidD [Planctomycetes bacterium]|nr:membrane protein insertion efficiency factor YidD [Planctomycetota bacterium]
MKAASSNPGRSHDRLHRALILIAVGVICFYQGMIRPFLVGGCKFHPTCSEYAIGALREHGIRSGSLLAIRRLIRCHPFSPGGIDPVPSTTVNSAKS